MYPYLEKAMEFLPLKTAPFLCQADLQRIYTGFGKLWYETGKKINLTGLINMLLGSNHWNIMKKQ